MNTPRFARLVARWLNALEVPREPDSGALERSISTVERALAARRRRRLQRRWGFGLAVALSLAGATLAFVSVGDRDGAKSHLVVTSFGSGAWVNEGEADGAVKLVAGTGLALRAGQWLNTASAGGAELVFATGTRVQVEEDSNLGVLSQDAHQRLVLRVGRLRAQVEKLTPGERFVVELPGAEVEVKGTKFELVARRDCSEGSQAEVRVEEGVVEVRVGAMRLRLGPGQQWRAECEAAPGASEPSASAPVPSAEEHEPAEMNERSARAKPSRAPDPERGSSELGSSLPEQNALFSVATEARRRGELDTALELYSELARRFPSSALTESALLARVRLLVTRAPTRARTEARLFLERYPDSAARAELQSLLESP